MTNKKPNGYTIFCDDIRHEVGSKFSLMGVYGHEMTVHHTLPVTLRMGFYVMFREDPYARLSTLTLRLYQPGDPDGQPSHKLEIERDPNSTPPPPADLGPSAWRTSGINVVYPITIKEPGKIKVRMLVGDETKEVKLGTLAVKSAPPPSAEGVG